MRAAAVVKVRGGVIVGVACARAAEADAAAVVVGGGRPEVGGLRVGVRREEQIAHVVIVDVTRVVHVELLEQLGHIKAVNIAASSMFFEVQKDSLTPENLDSILQKAINNQTSLIKNAIQKYKNYQNCRPQEIIALYSAAIRATTTDKNSSKFQQQHDIQTLTKQISAIDGERAAFTLSELLTETLETHA